MAIRDAIRLRDPTAQVQLIEALDHASPIFVRSYRDAYLAGVSCAPRVAGWLYNRSDRRPSGGGLALALERAALRDFLRLESILNADVIVTTHFLCARVLSQLRGRAGCGPLAVCVTDQHPHGIWLVPHADLLMVASDSARATAIAAGVPPQRVIATGIPIDPRFRHSPDRAQARLELGIPLDRPVALVCGGGLGLGGMERTVESLLSHHDHAHVVVVCGKNEALRARLQPLARAPGRAGPSCQVLGFTREMARFMAASDVLVGKPGGLTTSEAAASGLPMVLLKPLPGQEERNAARLVSSGAAQLHHDSAIAGRATAILLGDPARRAAMRQQALSVAMPNAGLHAAIETLALAGSKGAAHPLECVAGC